MRDFPRPVPVEVSIYGEPHQLHRLTYADAFELLGQLAGTLKDGASIQSAVEIGLDAMGPLGDQILLRSFPTFTEWDTLTVSHAQGLFEVLVAENDLPGILKNFSRLRDKMEKMIPPSRTK